MASDVLAVIFISAVLIGFAYSSIDAHAEYDIINDTASFAWQDLRNEIHQGDAITYELGTPQYTILNADEPLEIITPDQPGYYESLKRFEAAAKKHAEENQSNATTTPPEGTKQGTEIPKDKGLPFGEKKIRFIILNSKKKSKNSKIYLDVPEHYQQDAMKAETSKNNSKIKTKASYITEAELWTQQFNDDSEAQSKGKIDFLNSFQETKQNQSTPLKSNATKYAVKSLEEFTPNNIMNNSNFSVLPHNIQEFVTESPQTETLPATENPPEALTQFPSTFLTYNPFTEETTPNQKSKEPYTTGMNWNEPTYEAPPHIRDFEYLYRSALGLRSTKN